MLRIVLVAALSLAGCGNPIEPHPPTSATADQPSASAEIATGPVRTDRPDYVLTNGPQGPETTIVTTLRAPPDQSLHLMNCNGATGVSLQRRIGEQWVYAWSVAMNACLSPAIVIPPGGEHTAQVVLNERSGGASYPEGARMIESGTYRVVWTGVLLSFDPDERGFGPELPLEQRVSAPFSIVVPQDPGES